MHLRSADTAPLGPRPSSEAITPDFAATWPAVETPLRRYLGSIGVNRHDIDDLVQETASRAIGFKVPYHDAGDLRAWSFVVARRLLADLHRSRKRQEAFDGTQRPDPTQDDLMRQVEDRLVLETVVASAAQLTVAERRHLTVRSRGTAAERNRANVARHRARQRLRKLVGPLVGVLVLVRRRTAVATASVGVAALAIPLVLLPSIGQLGSHASGPAAVQSADTKAAAATSTIRRPSAPAAHRVSHRRPTAATAVRPPMPDALIPSVRARGPAGSNAHASVQGNDGKQPLVCTTGTIVQSRCVDLPPGIDEDT
jgi:DNA-directed RNA polymerase specialized sigma24 family protein